MTYGVLNGLEAIFPAAKKRDIKVIAILWIDKDKRVNTDSIAHGIALALEYPETIIRLSCGSEVRTRNNFAFDGETERCLNALREAKVSQPIGVIDTWWEWCNRTQPCHQNQFSAKVDWIGINIFPWWENLHADLFPCVNANDAADFHLARWQEVKNANPTKEVIVTEFGWVYAPEGKGQINLKTKKECGVASRKNQQLVVQSTFKKLAEKKVSAVAFEAFSENWKPNEEGDFGRYWGLCDSTPPYNCHLSLKLNH
jgi:exo-beta-1,3-glucanase (GH17 family)